VGITSEIIFSMYFIDRMSQRQIANQLFISQPYISKCVKKYKAILLENLKK
jgi:DNA-directed RNA polymerase specialized sigma subunit